MNQDPRERRRLAGHEGGHAVMALVLGRPVGLVSIEPGRHYVGATTFRRGRLRDQEIATLERPAPLMSARLRKTLEVEALVLLAGRFGEILVRDDGPSHYSEPQDEDEARLHADSLVGLTPRERAALDELRTSDDPAPWDEKRAEEIAWSLVGAETAASYLRWLTDCTRQIVYGPSFQRHHDLVVPVLARAGTLSGRALRALVNNGKEEQR